MHATRRPAPHRRAPSGAHRRQRRWLAATGYAALALACLGLGGAAFLLVAPPLDSVRDRLVAEVKARTGRTLTVAGPMSVALLPRVVVSLHGIAMLPPEGMAGAPTLTAPSIDAETSLWSLLSRRPRIERITVHRPTIELAVDAQGRRSWEAAAPTRRPSTAEAADGKDALAEGLSTIRGVASVSTTSAPPRQRRPWAVRLVDGTVHYRDERAGTAYEIGALTIDAAEDAPGVVTVDGAFVWQGETFHVSGVGPMRGASPSPGATLQVAEQVILKLSGAPLELAYGGTLGWRGGFAAEGRLVLQRLAYKHLKLGPATFDVSADAGALKLVLREADMYGGRGDGNLTLDTSVPTPAVTAHLKLTGVALAPLLGDLDGIGWLDGRGTVTLDLAGQGRSEQQIVESLRGKVQVSVSDGAVTGIDIDKSMRALQRGRLDRLAPKREDRTPFSALSGTFDIADGIARSRDLKLDSARIEVDGEGQMELGPRRIDVTLHTKITGDKADDGALLKIGKMELPITVTGPLERPKFAISGMDAQMDAIKQIGKALRSREVQDAIGGFLRGGEKRAKPESPGESPKE